MSTPTPARKRSLSLSLSLSLSHSLTLSLSLSLAHSLTHTHSLTPSFPLSLSLSLALSLSHTHTLILSLSLRADPDHRSSGSKTARTSSPLTPAFQARTALMEASEAGDEDVVDMQLSSGAQTDLQNRCACPNAVDTSSDKSARILPIQSHIPCCPVSLLL